MGVRLGKSVGESGSDVGLGLAKTHDAFAFFPLAALLEDRDALEAFQDVAFGADGGGGGAEAGMLGHGPDVR